MVKKQFVIINNKDGIHARPSAIIAQEAQKYKSKINISFDKRIADAKNILSLITLGMFQYAEVELVVEDEDENMLNEVFSVIKTLLEKEYNLR